MSRSEGDEKNSSTEMCSVKVMLMQLLSSLLAIREEEWITLFLEVINCLYCSGTAWIHWLGNGAAGKGAWTGCSPRTGKCPDTGSLGPGGGFSAPARQWEGAHSPEGRGGNCWVAVPGHRWCFCIPGCCTKLRCLTR